MFKEPGIDSKESIPPVYVALRAGTTTPFLLGSSPHRLFKNSSTGCFQPGHAKVVLGPIPFCVEPPSPYTLLLK